MGKGEKNRLTGAHAEQGHPRGGVEPGRRPSAPARTTRSPARAWRGRRPAEPAGGARPRRAPHQQRSPARRAQDFGQPLRCRGAAGRRCPARSLSTPIAMMEREWQEESLEASGPGGRSTGSGHPSMLSRLASWRAPAAEAQTAWAIRAQGPLGLVFGSSTVLSRIKTSRCSTKWVAGRSLSLTARTSSAWTAGRSR